ncbi:MAG: RNA polymerase sigma factor [Flavobacteriales bacterium]
MRLFKPSYNSMSDEDLMVALSNGDKRAFDELYERYAKPLLGYFMRMLWRDREKSEDCVHDLFAKIVNKPELFDTSRNFKTWVYSVANNMGKNEYKKAEVRKGMSNGLDNHYTLYDTNVNVMNEVQDSFFQDAFVKSLADLDEKHQEAFTLRHMEGLSIKEIAEVLDLNEGTVKSRLFYATKYLAESLKDFNPIENR